MTANFYRAVASVCTILSSTLFWLAGFMLNESRTAFPGQKMPAGEWLVPGLLFFAAVPLAVLIIKHMIPRIVTNKSRNALWIAQTVIILIFIVLFALGLFYQHGRIHGSRTDFGTISRVLPPE